MRFRRLPVSFSSLAATAIIAATTGVVTALWPSEPLALAAYPVVVEEISVTAPAETDVVVRMRPQRAEYLTGETVVLEATIRNQADHSVDLDGTGVYDLAVQRASSPVPMRVGDVAFVALAEAAPQASVRLAPGQETIRLVTVGGGAPFEQPGRYRVSGSWLGAEEPAAVEAFEVLISDTEAVANAPARGQARAPGA